LPHLYRPEKLPFGFDEARWGYPAMKELRLVFTTAADKSYRAQLADADSNKPA
jgi:hypothetical protein